MCVRKPNIDESERQADSSTVQVCLSAEGRPENLVLLRQLRVIVYHRFFVREDPASDGLKLPESGPSPKNPAVHSRRQQRSRYCNTCELFRGSEEDMIAT